MMRVSSPVQYHGAIFDVHLERWECDDGLVYQRDVVRKSKVVGILATDAHGFWLARQKREAVCDEHYVEIPAGLCDVEGASPLDDAKRELAEECGLAAKHWEHIAGFHTSPGFTDEFLHLYWATGLTEVERPPADDDVEVFRVPHERLDAYLATVTDAKTLIALQWLKMRRGV